MCAIHRHNKRGWFLLRILLGLAFVAVISLVVMLLWNALLPAIFGLKAISYLQALGLLILSKIIFSGFGRPHKHYHRPPWVKRPDVDAGGSTEETK